MFTTAMVVMYALILNVFQLGAVVEEFSEYSAALVVVLLVMGNVTFLLFDRVLERLTILYQRKRKK